MASSTQNPQSLEKPSQQAREARAQSAAAADQEEEFEEEEYAPSGRRFLLFNAVPSWLVSMVVHAVILLLMAWLTFEPKVEDEANDLVVAPSEDPQIEELTQEIQPLDVEQVESTDASPQVQSTTEVTTDVPEVTEFNDPEAAAVAVELSDFGERTAPRNDLMAEVGALTGNGLSGRGAGERGKMVAKYGGNEASENAVAMALKWIADHQLPDGSWSFDHTRGPVLNGRPRTSPNPGNIPFNNRFGATGMALLPFLGAGQTHLEGKYKDTVKAGLAYLIQNGQVRNYGGVQTLSFHENGGRMYSHGICAIVLCEAYAMTNDRELMAPAQLSLNFIAYAQDPVGGGWRYQPRTPGDTSVVGWQLMALKSGHMAYLQVPPQTVKLASRFLDAVSANDGANYGYTGPGSGAGTTSVGLISRMYLGWKQDNPSLERGAQWLAQRGPSTGRNANMYYNYYATQVMKQFYDDGDEWNKWNVPMRDFLVESQSKNGASQGSWFFGGGHANEKGGRLYCTSMATMVLEVYYRHLPIYQKQAAEEDFPL